MLGVIFSLLLGVGTDLEVRIELESSEQIGPSFAAGGLCRRAGPAASKLTRNNTKCPRVGIILQLAHSIAFRRRPNSCALTTSLLRACLHLFQRDSRFDLGRSPLIFPVKIECCFSFFRCRQFTPMRHAPLHGELWPCRFHSVLLSSHLHGHTIRG